MAWDINGRHVLITGGNSGIGKATAEELALRGAQVTITTRDPQRGAAAAEEIASSTGALVEVEQLDLARLDSIRAFAARFSADPLDVLINNAGVMTGKRLETPDGFEWTFGVNHLGPFLLTNLLRDQLLADVPSRVITVSSENYRRAKAGLDFEDLQSTRGFSPNMAYARSKLANSFAQGAEGSKSMGLMMRVLRPFLATPAQGASTSVHLATASDEEIGRGLYWADQDVKDRLPIASDRAAAERLWDVSAALVGL